MQEEGKRFECRCGGTEFSAVSKPYPPGPIISDIVLDGGKARVYGPAQKLRCNKCGLVAEYVYSHS
jgi:hypothetical protein